MIVLKKYVKKNYKYTKPINFSSIYLIDIIYISLNYKNYKTKAFYF